MMANRCEHGTEGCHGRGDKHACEPTTLGSRLRRIAAWCDGCHESHDNYKRSCPYYDPTLHERARRALAEGVLGLLATEITLPPDGGHWRREAWARADDRLRAYCQEMHVKGSGGSMSKLGAADQHGYPLLEGPEAWSARGRKSAGEIVRAWRAVVALDRRRPDLACALVRLHGDALPGDRGVNPFAASYKADLAREYALVADRVGLGSWAELKAALQKRKAAGPEAEMARGAMLREAAKRSEHLIVAATRGYREEHGRAE